MLEIEHVSKEYRRGVRANDNISLSVEVGEIFSLLGPNGAGKTTLVSQIIGLATPTSGKIRIAGVDVVANPGYARQACSFQPQTQVPIDGVTPLQAIELIGRMRGGQPKRVRQRARKLIDALEIGQWAEKRGENLSGGVRRLVAFCMAVVVPGQLVILDEPTNDVDPLRRRLLWQEVRTLTDMGSSVLLVTHNVLEAERSVDRLAIIDRGRVIGTGTPASLKEHEAGYLRLELIMEPTAELPALPAFVYRSVIVGRRWFAKVEATWVGPAVEWVHGLKEKGIVEEFSIGPATLEDIYVRMIGRPDALEVPTEEVNHVPVPLAQ
ncbi:MAG: ABC transporter ATP-binding protein [Candidatus Bipolaricaulia bacterium]